MVNRAIEPIVNALRKAEEHLAAADAIATLGNHPMAFSHIVLGLEEMAVAKLHKGALLGLFAIGGVPTEHELLRLDRKELYLHGTKLLTIVLYAAVWKVHRVRVEAILDAQRRGAEPVESEIVRLEEAAMESTKPLIEDLQRLEPLKEGGLYSAGFDRKGEPAVRATQLEFDRWRTVLADCIDAEQFFLTHPDEKVDDFMLGVARQAKSALEKVVRTAIAEQKASEESNDH